MTDKLRSVLLISSDIIGPRMAGTGIRYYELSRALSPVTNLTLAAPGISTLPPGAPDGLRLVTYDTTPLGQQKLYDLAQSCEVLVVQGNVLYHFPKLKSLCKFMVVDLYDPLLLESLQLQKNMDPDQRRYHNLLVNGMLNEQLMLGDFFICGSEKQRDYWLGMLSALGRINPATNDAGPNLRHLIDLVPFGLPENPPRSDRVVLKGVHPGIASDDKVVLWGGGIWEWFDAPALIRAMALVVRQRPDIKLFFMGVKHPNPVVPEMKACRDTIALAQQLGLLNRNVFFNDWTPYEERQNYLLEADLGISLHLDHIETRFSLRTRIFDYIWAGLPIISTRGDAMSELVSQHGLGRVVDEGAIDQIAAAILELLARPDLKASFQPAFELVQPALSWPQAIRPLIEYCIRPYHAADYSPAEAGVMEARPGAWAQSRSRQALETISQVLEIETDRAETVRYAQHVEQAYHQKAQQLEQINFAYQAALQQRNGLEAALFSSRTLLKILAVRLLLRLRWPFRRGT